MAKRTTTFNSIEVSTVEGPCEWCNTWRPLFKDIFFREFADATAVVKANEDLFAPTQRLRIVSVKLTDAKCRNKVFL